MDYHTQDSDQICMMPIESIKKEVVDDSCVPERSFRSMRKVPSMSDLSEESSLGKLTITCSSTIMLSLPGFKFSRGHYQGNTEKNIKIVWRIASE